jgi:hypothetical protein
VEVELEEEAAVVEVAEAAAEMLCRSSTSSHRG